MDTIRVCVGCGAKLAVDAPEGLCPQCLLRGGLDTHTTVTGGTSGSTGFVPPAPAELAKHFPQLEILELLGQGGMGVVYKARQRELDRLVALKLLSRETGQNAGAAQQFAQRFAQEARSLARLNHPNIVAVYDFGQAGEYFYFLMEFVDGTNLRQLLQGHKLSQPDALAIVPKICEFAHDEGIVHRDIKPENILIDKKGRVKIADFGLSKLLGRAPTDYRLTGPQTVMGTPHYMAPEQLERPLEVDHRADIYSLGVVFYEMLTGDLPLGRFAAPSEKVQMDARLDEVVLRTLENRPERRYQHASEVKTDLDNISGLIERLPPSMRRAFGFEHRSQTNLWGLPLLHIAFGLDPATGRKRVAKGIIAVGDVAKGVVAMGGVAMGGIAIGGFAVGVVPLAGFGVGLISIGGCAIGLIFAYGGSALAPIAMGGVAFGYYAMGGAAWGAHALAGNSHDQAAQAFFSPTFTSFRFHATIWGLVIFSMLTSMLIPLIVWWRGRSRH